MPLHRFSAAEIDLVQQAFPGLALVEEGIWRGPLEFNAAFDGRPIHDAYEVEIIALDGYPGLVPLLREIGGRTQKIADKYGIRDLKTLHHNPGNGTACVCVKQEERSRFPHGSNLLTFINDLAIPYLYGLSFFEEHGRWPWPEYSHGGLGLLEFYAGDSREQGRESVEELTRYLRSEVNWKVYSKQVRKPSPDRVCPCGSTKPFQECHPDAWQGIQRLHADILRLHLNPRSLFQPRSNHAV